MSSTSSTAGRRSRCTTTNWVISRVARRLALRFPLSIRDKRGRGGPVVRSILAFDETSHPLTFAGDAPNGSRAQLMHPNHDRLMAGATRAATDSTATMTAEPALALTIRCVGRRLDIETRAEEETEAALETVPRGSHPIGFYSYGEFSPANRATC